MAYTRPPPPARRRQQATWNGALTVKRVLVIFIFIALSDAHLTQAQLQREPRLGSKCQHDMDCTDFIKGSACSANGYCECAPYFVQYNATSCLSSQLLGGDCVLNDQCTMKVANSSCLDGACRCVEGFLQFRKHTCLGPAPPGSVCYSHAHCGMFDKRSHCDFLIPNLFGRCQCTAPTKLVRGFCVEDKKDVIPEVSTPAIAATTTTSTTSSTTTTTTKATTTTSTTTTTTTPAPPRTTTETQPQPDEPVRHDSVEEQSFSEEKIDDSPANSDADMDSPTTTTHHTLLTPAAATNDKSQEPEAAGDDEHEHEHEHETTPIVGVFDDYPYKIDEDYEQEIDDEQQQQQIMEEQEQEEQQILDKQDEEQQQMLDNQNHMVEEEKRVEEEEAQRVEDAPVKPIEEQPQLLEQSVGQQQLNENENVVAQDTNVAETVNGSVDMVAPPMEAQDPVKDVEHIEPEEVIKEEEEKIVAEHITLDEQPNQGTDQQTNEHEDSEVEEENALPTAEHVETEEGVRPEQVLDETNEKETTQQMENAAETEHGVEEVQEISKFDDINGVGSEDSVTEPQISETNSLLEKDQFDQEVSEDEQKLVETPTNPATVVDMAPVEKPEHNESVDETSHNGAPDGLSAENLYLENHLTADEMEMYEDLEQEGGEHEEESGGVDDTMKFDYEVGQEDFNEEHTEAGNDDVEPQVVEKEPLEGEEEAQAADGEPQVVEEEPQVDEKEPQVSNEGSQVADEEPQVAEEEPQVAEEEPHVAEKEPQVAEEEQQVAEEEPQAAAEEPQQAGDHLQEAGVVSQLAEEALQEVNEVPIEAQKAPQETEIAAAVHPIVADNEIPEREASHDVHEIENKNEITEQKLEEEEESKLNIEGDSESETPAEVEQQPQQPAESISEATEKVENESNIPDNELTADNVDTKPAFQKEEQEDHKDNVESGNNASHDEFTELADLAAATTERIEHVVEEESVVAPEGDPNKSNSDDERILDATQVPTNDNDDNAGHIEHSAVIGEGSAEPQQISDAAADTDGDATPAHATEENYAVDSEVAASEIDQQVVNAEELEAPNGEQENKEPAELETAEPSAVDNAENFGENVNEVKQEVADEAAAEAVIATTETPLVPGVESETEKQIEDFSENDNEFAGSESHTELLEIEHATEVNAAEDMKLDEGEFDKRVTEDMAAEKDTPTHEMPLQTSSLDDHLVKHESGDSTEQPLEVVTEVTYLNEGGPAKETDKSADVKPALAEEINQFVTSTSVDESNQKDSDAEHENPSFADNSIRASEEVANVPEGTLELSAHESDVKEKVTELPILDYGHVESYEVHTPAVPQDHVDVLAQEPNNELAQKIDQSDSNFINFSNQNVEMPQSGSFEEQQSIADILSDLMTEDEQSTNEPETETATDLQVEVADFTKHENENDDAQPELALGNTADLVAADSNIAEEKLANQENNKDKLFNTENQDLSVQASNDIEIQNEPQNATHTAQQLTELDQVVTQDLPNDLTSIGTMQPQELESFSLVLEGSTLPSVDKGEATVSGADAAHDVRADEATAMPDDFVEITTQTLLGLASRVTLMEPAAPIVTTLEPLMAEATSESDFTPEPVKDVVSAENILANKASSEIRKRVELGSEAVSLGLSCMHDRQCQLADPNALCNARGVCDCATTQTTESSMEAQCSAQRTGCAPGTFQCRSSGVCISWFFVCDGRPDCNDDSDEECTFNVRLNQTCPQEAFQCARSGRCISRAARCDGRKQCPHGEDEHDCNALKSGQCPPNTFRCKSGECLPEYEYCNAIISCRDGSDEPPHLCGSRSMPTFFLRLLNAGGLLENEDAYCPHRCSNGRCRSTAIVCSGRDGCGDGTDEKTCSVCRCPAPYINSLPSYLARNRPMPLW